MANRFLSNIRINDAYTFPASDGSNGQFIKTDGSGNLSFADPSASSSASVIYRDNFTGDGSTVVFDLQNSLTTEDQSFIYIDGVYQEKDTYSLSSTQITFTTAPISGHSIEVISIAGINTGPTVIYQDNFTGNGSSTDFTLAQVIDNEVKTFVFLNGVYQFKGTYAVDSTTLSFDTAPANGVDIEVISIASATQADSLQAGAVIIPVKNTHTASIAKGEPVYITGNVGASERLQIAPADASNSAKMPSAGLLLTTLAVNAEGYVITGGYLRNLTTDTIDGTSTSSNDTVYVKPGGGLTMTKPTGSNLIQNVAKVARSSGGSSGSLLVSSILRTNDVPNLTTGKIWVGDGNTIESTVIHLDESNNRLGINNNSPSYSLDVTGDANISSNVIVGGNLTVQGTETILNTQTVEVEDNILQLNTTQSSPDTATATTSGISIYRGDGVTQASFIFDDGDDTWDLTNNLVVDGHVGIGVTPKSWGTNGDTKAIQISTMTSLSEAFDGTQLASNFYFNGTNDKYIQSDFATSYLQIDGTHRWRYAASGTADANITWGEAMRIDSSGRVGIGVTPEAWTVFNPVLRIGAGGALTGTSANNFRMFANTYYDGSYKRIASGVATQYEQDGYHAWYTAASDTADSTISWSERMRINSSGNVGIGTTSPDLTGFGYTTLTVVGGTPAGYAGVLELGSPTTNANGQNLGIIAFMDGSTRNAQINVTRASSTSTSNMHFYINGGSGIQERMRITSGGNVNISTSGAQLFFADNGEIRCNDAFHRIRFRRSENILEFVEYGDIIFTTGSTTTERMRITSGGNVAIGETGARNARLLLNNTGSSGQPQLMLIDSGDSSKQSEIRFDSGTLYFEYWSGSSRSERMRIDSSGNTTFAGTINSDNITVGKTDGNNSSISLTANTGNWTFTNVQASRNLEISDSDGTGTVMTIDTSGRVGIGTTSPSAKLHIADGNNYAQLGDLQGNSTMSLRMADNAASPVEVQAYGTELRFNTSTTSGATPSVKMNITSGGNVGIGTTSPSEIFHVNKNATSRIVGAYFTNSQANTGAEAVSIAFGLNRSGGDFVRKLEAIEFGAENQWTGTPSTVNSYLAFNVLKGESAFERMRINSIGVNVTSHGAHGVHLKPDSADTNNSGRLLLTRVGGSGWAVMNNSTNFSIRSGAIPASTSGTEKIRLTGYSATSWTSGSDETIKENIRPIDNVLDKINDYRCVEYNLIDDETKDKKIGFIAQDWQGDFPQIIEQMENEKIGMKYTETIPILLKAIQELKAEIETLKLQING